VESDEEKTAHVAVPNDAADSDDEHRISFVNVNELHRGSFVLMRGQFPCRVVETSTSKTGKHGHAKVHVICLDIFTGKKYEDIIPSCRNVEVPEIERKELEVARLDGSRLSVRGKEGHKPHHDMVLPDDDMGERIARLVREAPTVVLQVQAWGGDSKIVAARAVTKRGG